MGYYYTANWVALGEVGKIVAKKKPRSVSSETRSFVSEKSRLWSGKNLDETLINKTKW